MANIVFKTRGNSNPQGKSRVYFCAHPKDYGVFFEEISEDILKYQKHLFPDTIPKRLSDRCKSIRHFPVSGKYPQNILHFSHQCVK